MAANRTREIRPSGMRGGLRGNVDYGGTRILPRNRKSGVVMNLCLRLRAPRFYPANWLHRSQSSSNSSLCSTAHSTTIFRGRLRKVNGDSGLVHLATPGSAIG